MNAESLFQIVAASQASKPVKILNNSARHHPESSRQGSNFILLIELFGTSTFSIS